MEFIVCPFLILAGLTLVLLPARWILHFDRVSGYYVYQKELAAFGDEQKALKKASQLYKTMGCCIAALASAVLIAIICSS